MPRTGPGITTADLTKALEEALRPLKIQGDKNEVAIQEIRDDIKEMKDDVKWLKRSAGWQESGKAKEGGSKVRSGVAKGMW